MEPYRIAIVAACIVGFLGCFAPWAAVTIVHESFMGSEERTEVVQRGGLDSGGAFLAAAFALAALVAAWPRNELLQWATTAALGLLALVGASAALGNDGLVPPLFEVHVFSHVERVVPAWGFTVVLLASVAVVAASGWALLAKGLRLTVVAPKPE